jgi:TonB-linked SusC/RagA family outer membrane protein
LSIAWFLPAFLSAQAASNLAARSTGSEGSLLKLPARLKVEHAPLAAALAQLTETSGALVSFSPSLLPAGAAVDCDCAGMTVGDALTHLLRGTTLWFSELQGQVIIFPGRPLPVLSTELVREQAVTDAPNAFPSVLQRVPLPPSVQDQPLFGVVLDGPGGRPVGGAQVSVVGTALSVYTDVQGRFRFSNVGSSTPTVRVRMIGYRPLERQVRTGDPNLRLELTPTAIVLDELVTTGTVGEATRRTLGNAISRIDAPDIVDASAPKDMTQLLQARAPGVNVIAGSGMVGQGALVSIRGQNSMYLGEQPLVYVDGVRVNGAAGIGGGNVGQQITSRLSDINPQDIESIEIIKGPAAATLYGSEANNGVIQVITKRGRAGRTSMEVSTRIGTQWFSRAEQQWPTNYFCATKSVATATGGGLCTSPIISQNLYQTELQGIPGGVDSLPHGPIFKTGGIQGYSINVSGGTNTLQYYSSADFDRELGIEPDNSGRRFSGRLNATFQPHPTVDITTGMGALVSHTNFSDQIGQSLISVGMSGVPRDMLTALRGWQVAPKEVMENTTDIWQDIDRFTGSIKLNHRPTSWLTQRLTAGLDVTTQNDVWLTPRMPDNYASQPGGVAFFGANARTGRRVDDTHDYRVLTFDYSATAKLNLTKALSASTSAGGQIYLNKLRYNEAVGSNFPSISVQTVAGGATKSFTDQLVVNNTVGGFVQEQLGFHDRLFLTAALRSDRNSAFGSNLGYLTYPKLSTSWVVSEEPFWPLPFVTTLKLRAAYGRSGQQPDAFARVRSYEVTTTATGETGVSPQNVGNPDLKPEQGQEVEIGFEGSLFKDRVGIDFTYYNQHTKDAIVQTGVPQSSGFSGNRFVNAGEVLNKGIELLVNARPIESRRLGLEIGINFATNHNELLTLGVQGLPFLLLQGQRARNQAGYPLNSWFQRVIVGGDLNPDGVLIPGSAMCSGGPGNPPVNCTAGDGAPLLFIGTSTPKYGGAVFTTLRLGRNLRLYGSLDFQGGHRKLENTITQQRCATRQLCYANVHPNEFDVITQANNVLGTAAGNAAGFMFSGSYARLRELSLSYTLPRGVNRILRASRSEVTVVARNLKTWTGYPGWDPESVWPRDLSLPLGPGNVAPAGLSGSNQNMYPMLAQFVVAVKLVF